METGCLSLPYRRDIWQPASDFARLIVSVKHISQGNCAPSSYYWNQMHEMKALYSCTFGFYLWRCKPPSSSHFDDISLRFEYGTTCLWLHDTINYLGAVSICREVEGRRAKWYFSGSYSYSKLLFLPEMTEWEKLVRARFLSLREFCSQQFSCIYTQLMTTNPRQALLLADQSRYLVVV